ncbi:hypothetical protein ACET3Z_019056 [Daucus carota]
MSGDGKTPPAIAGAAKIQYRMAKTSVWWDIENCQVPRGFDVYGIAQNISSALAKMSYCGPISISAYGDILRIPKPVQEALNSTGISLNHVPAGVKDASDKKILVDMLLWAVDNPAPANYLLISGDRDFSNALHQLRMRRYNILLAQPPRASAALVAAAESVWLWATLLTGGYPLATGGFLQLGNNSNILHSAASQGLGRDASLSNKTAGSYSENIPSSNHRFIGPAVAGAENQPLITRALSVDTAQPENAPVRQIMSAPHEFFGVNKPVMPASISQPTQQLSFNMIDISSFPTSEVPSKISSISKSKLDNSMGKAPQCRKPSDYIEGLIGVVLLALHHLKLEKLIPSEANIKDCIRYGELKFRNIDVEKAINFAVEHQMIVKQSQGAVSLYVGRIERLWECVDTSGGNQYQYSKATWDGIQKFLCSSAGHSAMMASECRYQAGLILKTLCLKDLSLGEEFVTEVLQMIELEDIQDSIVGIPGVSGISFEQRKRLTIAVELVSNPSILFMDEPTSGLDARAAAIVMRVVKNIVRTKRTVVCTIHQPSIDIFEAFDEFLGIGNCNSILSLIATERSVVYRERFAGMYSSWTYSLAQVIVEIPYIFLQSCIFIIITYPAIGFYWSVAKGFWYLYTMFCTMLYYTYIGMMFVSMTRSFQVASVTSSFFNTMTALLSGFLIPEPQMPKWWVWCYWILPTSWSLRSFITTQYGDVDKEIGVLGEKKATNAFLESYYGYRSGDTCLVAIVLAAFPFAFASLFIYFSAKLNFQRR